MEQTASCIVSQLLRQTGRRVGKQAGRLPAKTEQRKNSEDLLPPAHWIRFRNLHPSSALLSLFRSHTQLNRFKRFFQFHPNLSTNLNLEINHLNETLFLYKAVYCIIHETSDSLTHAWPFQSRFNSSQKRNRISSDDTIGFSRVLEDPLLKIRKRVRPL